MCRVAGVLGTVALLAWLGAPAQAQYNPNGWIQTDGWNFLVPLTQNGGCAGGGTARMAMNWVAPHSLPFEDPKSLNEWADIDFGGAAQASGWGATALGPSPIWFTTALLESAFQSVGLDIPSQDVVWYDTGDDTSFDTRTGIIQRINEIVVPVLPAGTPTLPRDDALGIATTYVENLTGAPLPVEICTASDDSVQAWVNNIMVTNVSSCRGTAGDCAEIYPAILPVGVSKITTLTFEGGGAWGFRLALEVAGSATKLNDASTQVKFLGPGVKATVGQVQYVAWRSVAGTDPFGCDADTAVVSIVGNAAAGADGDALQVVENIHNIESADMTISGVSDGGVVADTFQPVGKKITWNVTRADVNAGLAYTLSTTGSLLLTFSGKVGNESAIFGASPYTLAHKGTGPIGIFDDSHDIGAPPTQGLTIFAAGAYAIFGSGADIWDGGDDFQFAYKHVTGDFVAICRLVDEGTNNDGYRWGRHGLMARWSCDRDAKFSMIETMFPTVLGESEQDWPRHHFRLYDRNVGNNRDYIQAYGWNFFKTESNRPTWQKLVRVGNAFYSFLAEDANADNQPDRWVFWGSDSAQSVPDTLLVGIAVQGRQDWGNTAVFDNVSIVAYSTPDAAVTEGTFLTGTDYPEPDGSAPSNGRVIVRGGTWTPQVQSGRLRVTEDGVGDSAVAVWYPLPGTDMLTANGFLVEFDAFMVKPGGVVDPADGFTFGVVQMGPCNVQQTPLVNQLTGRTFVGPDNGGGSTTIGVPGPGPFRSISTSGGDIWEPCDNFEFAHSTVRGDFDIAVEILGYANAWAGNIDDDEGRWGKSGLMARQTLSRDSRYTMSQMHGPGNLDDARQAGRTVHEISAGCTVGGGMYEDVYSFAGERPRFLRLTRRGNILQGWASSEPGLATGELDPCNDCNWPSKGREDDWGPNSPYVLFVGFANSQNASSGTAAQTIDFRLLTACGPAVSTPWLALGGDGGGALGWNAGTLRSYLQDHPGFAIEMDNWYGGGEPGNEPYGWGSPDFDGKWHAGIDIGASVSSIQTNVDFGAGLPDIFAPEGIHMEVFYAPTGLVETYATANDGSFPRTKILSSRIFPLEGPIMLGFTGATGGANVRQEIDNVAIRSVCSETRDSVSVDHATQTVSVGSNASITATPNGADGAATYAWTKVSGTGSIVGRADQATVAVTSAVAGIVVVEVASADGICSDTAKARATVTFQTGGGRQRIGDGNQDGKLDISDPIWLLGHLFLGTFKTLPCGGSAGTPNPGSLALMDFNGDKKIDISDPIGALGFLFTGGSPPALGTSCVPIVGCPDKCTPP